ncbi:hypothetical protein V6Z12_D10G077200 [Gossypium hirsutum]
MDTPLPSISLHASFQYKAFRLGFVSLRTH